MLASLRPTRLLVLYRTAAAPRLILRLRATKALPLPPPPEPPSKHGSYTRVLEKDISMITVDADVFAKRPRTRTDEKQLQCVGGSMMDLRGLHPRTMQCINVGVDVEGNVNWVRHHLP